VKFRFFWISCRILDRYCPRAEFGDVLRWAGMCPRADAKSQQRMNWAVSGRKTDEDDDDDDSNTKKKLAYGLVAGERENEGAGAKYYYRVLYPEQDGGGGGGRSTQGRDTARR
jgi:hypothetical protein